MGASVGRPLAGTGLDVVLVVVVEFQSSSWSRGTYLNVGVNWLWTPKEYLTFDLSEPDSRMRVRLPGSTIHGTDFVDYRDDDEDFANAARMFAEAAAERISEFRTLFPTPAAAATYLRQAENPQASPHAIHDTAIASGLAGDMTGARELFARLRRLLQEQSAGREVYEWENDLRRRADELQALTDEPAAFLTRIERDIAEARLRLKLPADGSIPDE
jgi:hypothetical protein